MIGKLSLLVLIVALMAKLFVINATLLLVLVLIGYVMIVSLGLRRG